MEKNLVLEKPKKRKIIFKYILRGILSLIVIGFFYNWYWINSGSNEWKLRKDQDGIKIYSLKVPGDKIVKFRGVMKGDYTLAQLAAPHLVDHNLKTCKEWFPNCTGCEIVRPWDSVKNYDISLWTLDFPSPFQPRELLVNTSVTQDENKVVTLDVVAVPNIIEHTEGKVRLERMHNVWKFTPLEDGLVECSQTQDVSLGGFFPMALLNMVGVGTNFEFMKNELPMFLEKEKYKNAKFSFIEEVGESMEAGLETSNTSEEQPVLLGSI